MSFPVPADQQLTQVFIRAMARHGVVALKNEAGRVGSMTFVADHVSHFGVQIIWARPQDHAALWAAAQLPGTPPMATRPDEHAFFDELMRAVYEAGVERVVWTEETKVAFVRDEKARTGLSFRLKELSCTARGAEVPGLHL